MRNRAKCKLCGDVIESLHIHDYVPCKCGEIAVDGGEAYFRCFSKNWNNFLRVDDEDNEIIPTLISEEDQIPNAEEVISHISKKDLLDELDAMIDNIEKLPAHAKMQAVTNYDLCAALILLKAIFSKG